ncbi:hypothetical protein F4780DRAFT_717674 [Xylariomycetidae sp. FL0641]|nr:hypothetical protein F4780DRAFT_717674 [Xylariomycetidae sp. FL0641]
MTPRPSSELEPYSKSVLRRRLSTVSRGAGRLSFVRSLVSRTAQQRSQHQPVCRGPIPHVPPSITNSTPPRPLRPPCSRSSRPFTSQPEEREHVRIYHPCALRQAAARYRPRLSCMPYLVPFRRVGTLGDLSVPPRSPFPFYCSGSRLMYSNLLLYPWLPGIRAGLSPDHLLDWRIPTAVLATGSLGCVLDLFLGPGGSCKALMDEDWLAPLPQGQQAASMISSGNEIIFTTRNQTATRPTAHDEAS